MEATLRAGADERPTQSAPAAEAAQKGQARKVASTPSIQDLEARVELGLLKRIPHATLPLTIYSYTDRCTYERGWDSVTEAARGLVVDRDGRLVARPFSKFFNLGECPETMADSLPAEIPELCEKYDGSLVIAFWHGDKWLCCTRGAWESPQAKWAQGWLADRSAAWPEDARQYTLMFELCAPWNRIVVLYARTQMVLIGAIAKDQATDLPHAALCGLANQLGVCPAELKLSTAPQSVDLSEGEGEGYVARYPDGFRVKLKFDTYKRLHKLLTGLSVKGIWEFLASGQEPDMTLVPEEFLAWYREQRSALRAKYAAVEAEAFRIWNATRPADLSRKDLALSWSLLQPPVKATLFKLLDGKPYADVIWKALKPERGGEHTFQKDGEGPALRSAA